MVGVRRVQNCETCRLRRVKCDQVRPICTQCSKSGRLCRPPKPKVTFMKPEEMLRQPKPAEDTRPSVKSTGSMLVLRSKKTAEGALIQTVRFGHRQRIRAHHDPRAGLGNGLTAPLSITPADELRQQFFYACNSGTPGLRLELSNPSMAVLPRYIGHASALDEALKCLLAVHGDFQRPSGHRRMNAALYLQAIQCLQYALDDPKQQYSSMTLAAIFVLGYTEGIGSREQQLRGLVTHTSGARKLLKFLGPSILEDELARAVFPGILGLIIVTACLGGDCFLTEPRWSRAAFAAVTTNTSFQAKALKDVLAQFNAMSGILHHVRKVGKDEISQDELSTLTDEVLHIRAILNQLSADFATRHLYMTLPSSKGDNEVTNVYGFVNPAAARATNTCWAVLIMANGTVDNLYCRLVDKYADQASYSALLGALLDQNTIDNWQLSDRICRSVEFAQRYRPLGAMWMQFPLVMAVGFATEKRKQWILRSLNGFLEGLRGVKDYWRMNELEKHSMLYTGGYVVPPLTAEGTVRE